MKKLTLLLSIIMLVISSCKKDENNPASSKTYKVKYTMNCTDCETVYTSDTLGTQSVEYHKNSSWSYTFNAKKGQEVLFLAYNQSSTIQGVTATILLNDTVIQTQTHYCPFNGSAFVVDTIQ